MRFCTWRMRGVMVCDFEGVVEIPEGPRWLCKRHAADLDRQRAEARERARAAALRQR